MNGRPAYASSDLLEEHPTNPNIYKVYGRADDQIVLSTGEKVCNKFPHSVVILTATCLPVDEPGANG